LQTPLRITAFWALAALAAPAASAAPAAHATHCGDPNSSVGYFLQVVRTIALKYDLSDPGPIGTLIEGKLIPDPGRMSGKPGQVKLVSNTLFGKPATVVYSRDASPPPHERENVTLSISLPASWQAIDPEAVEACFANAGDKPRKSATADASEISWEKSIHRKVEGDGSVRVIWTADPHNVRRLERLAIVLDR
jgi:hypothetical protein